jgi:hypothetical protein
MIFRFTKASVRAASDPPLAPYFTKNAQQNPLDDRIGQCFLIDHPGKRIRTAARDFGPSIRFLPLAPFAGS